MKFTRIIEEFSKAAKTIGIDINYNTKSTMLNILFSYSDAGYMKVSELEAIEEAKKLLVYRNNVEGLVNKTADSMPWPKTPFQTIVYTGLALGATDNYIEDSVFEKVINGQIWESELEGYIQGCNDWCSDYEISDRVAGIMTDVAYVWEKFHIPHFTLLDVDYDEFLEVEDDELDEEE